MKNAFLILAGCCLGMTVTAQKKWDGEAGDNQWASAANWSPDGIPVMGEAVILDHTYLSIDYTVLLPPGNLTTELESLLISPAIGQKITLELPAANQADPGLHITGAGESLVLNPGACLINASAATTGGGILVDDLFRINDGASYIHRTSRGNAALIDHLSIGPGSFFGIFEFDVPGSSGYTVSLTGNHFGTMRLSASAAGGSKSYSGSGASTLTIHGNLEINPGVSFTSTMNADIRVAGDLSVEGRLNLHPSTTGTSNRSLIFDGKAIQQIKGAGSIDLGSNFRNMIMNPGSDLRMERDIDIPFPNQEFQVDNQSLIRLQTFRISGQGKFRLLDGGSVSIGSPDGIMTGQPLGNIQTSIREFSSIATFIYDGEGDQFSGDGLPDNFSSLVVNKNSGTLFLSKPIEITEKLDLLKGIIKSSNMNSLLLKNNCVLNSPPNNYGVQDGGWEDSFIDGPMKVETNSTGSLYLPIGEGNIFAPILLQPSSNIFTIYEAIYFKQSHANTNDISNPPLHHVSTLEYWRVEANSSEGPVEARVGLSWRPGSGVGTTSMERMDLRIAHFFDMGTGLKWNEEGNMPLQSGSDTYGILTSDKLISNFSDFTFASASLQNVLPIQLIYAKTFEKNDKVWIRWKVSDDREIQAYFIERKNRMGEFNRVDSVEPKKENRVIEYEISDPLPPTGRLEYRISMVRNTGKVDYSPIMSLFFDAKSGFRIYPNPAADAIHVNFENPRSDNRLEIVNISGQVLKTYRISALSALTVTVSDLPTGIYRIRLLNGNGSLSKFFLKR